MNQKPIRLIACRVAPRGGGVGGKRVDDGKDTEELEGVALCIPFELF